MPRKLYNKLVRDNMPEILRAQGGEPETRTLDEAEFKKLIRLKLVTDAGEARVAATRDELIKELADVLEIAEAIAAVEGIPMTEVTETKFKRRAVRGGFEKRIYLIAA